MFLVTLLSKFWNPSDNSGTTVLIESNDNTVSSTGNSLSVASKLIAELVSLSWSTAVGAKTRPNDVAALSAFS